MEPISQNPVENNMTYQVVYEREDGTSAVESCSTLDDAVVAAERLKNDFGIERPRIFETNEIRYDFQPYFRIRVVDDASGAILGGAAVASDAYVADDDVVVSYDDANGDLALEEPAPVESFTVGRDDAVSGGDMVEVRNVDAGVPDLPDAGMPDLPDADASLPAVEVPDSEMPIDLRDGALPEVDVPDADLPDVDLANAGLPDVEVPDVDAVTPDIDLTDAAPNVEGEKKAGLFSKFVDGLEGGSAPDTDDVIDDLGSATDTKPTRGLFGR